ncbi:hypothetical protein MP638_002149 [Amoeboaphelidium occidentale]|nr:hypothetical protein MP638_002149 [Amoeboaphelidium occidentale]
MSEKHNLCVERCEEAIQNLERTMDKPKPKITIEAVGYFARPILELDDSFTDIWSKNPLSEDYEPYSSWTSNAIPHVLALIGTICHEYVEVHIRQFLLYNDIMHVLSTPECQEKYRAAGAMVHNVYDYMESADRFDRLYPRVLPNGDGTGSRRAFELSCFQRWYIIKDFMRKNKIPRVFSADADTLIFVNVTEHILKHFADDKIILMWNYPTVSNSYISFDYEGITDMLAFFDYFFTHLSLYLPNVKEGNFFLYMNDMNLSKIYGIKAICGSNWETCPLLANDSVPKNHDAFYNTAYVFQPRLAFLVEKVAAIIPSSWTDSSKSLLSFDNNIASPLSIYETVETLKRVTFYNGGTYLTLKSEACPAILEEFPWTESGTNCSFQTLGLHFYSYYKNLMSNYTLTEKFVGDDSYCSCLTDGCDNCAGLQ